MKGELFERQFYRREFSDRRLKKSSAALSTAVGCHSLCLLSLGQARESKSPLGEKLTIKLENLRNRKLEIPN
jgi:hypothetical protein